MLLLDYLVKQYVSFFLHLFQYDPSILQFLDFLPASTVLLGQTVNLFQKYVVLFDKFLLDLVFDVDLLLKRCNHIFIMLFLRYGWGYFCERVLK